MRFLIDTILREPTAIAFLHPDRRTAWVWVSVQGPLEIHKTLHTIFLLTNKNLPVDSIMNSALFRIDCGEHCGSFFAVFFFIRIASLHRIITSARTLIESNTQIIGSWFHAIEFWVITWIHLDYIFYTKEIYHLFSCKAIQWYLFFYIYRMGSHADLYYLQKHWS